MKSILFSFYCFGLLLVTKSLLAQGPPDQILSVSNVVFGLHLNGDETTDVLLSYVTAYLEPNTHGNPRQNKILSIASVSSNDIFSDDIFIIATNKPSSSVKPVLLSENIVFPHSWGSGWEIWYLQSGRESGLSFGGIIAYGKAQIFGFKRYEPDGVHFGWARVYGTNGNDGDANIFLDFDTNHPPVFSDVTINPVPWAPIPMGRPALAAPILTFTRPKNDTLRLTYPAWGDRYAIRRRSRPKGDVAQVYPGGHEGLVATNGVFTVDVSLDQANGYFELFLPPANR